MDFPAAKEVWSPIVFTVLVAVEREPTMEEMVAAMDRGAQAAARAAGFDNAKDWILKPKKEGRAMPTVSPIWMNLETVSSKGVVVAVRQVNFRNYLAVCDNASKTRVFVEGFEPVVRSMYQEVASFPTPCIGYSNQLGGELRLSDYREFGENAIETFLAEWEE